MATIIKVLEQSKWHRIIEGLTDDGEVFRAFECKIDPDDPERLAALFEEDFEADYEREQFLKKHDPNKIDGRRVRHELRDDLVNLGMRVNSIPTRAKHW